MESSLPCNIVAFCYSLFSDTVTARVGSPCENTTHTLLDDLKSNAFVVRRNWISRMVFCVLLGLIFPCTSTEHLYRIVDMSFERNTCGQFTDTSAPTPCLRSPYARGLILRRTRLHEIPLAWGFLWASYDAPLDSSHLMSVITPIKSDTRFLSISLSTALYNISVSISAREFV